jgi:hypothetical protein
MVTVAFLVLSLAFFSASLTQSIVSIALDDSSVESVKNYV